MHTKTLFIAIILLLPCVAESQSNDTISLKEAIQGYNNKIVTCQFYQDSLVNSPENEVFYNIVSKRQDIRPRELAQYPEGSFRLVWSEKKIDSSNFLILEKILPLKMPASECEALYGKLKKTYKYNEKVGGIPAVWYTGHITFLLCMKKTYIGYVSRDKSVNNVENGEFVPMWKKINPKNGKMAMRYESYEQISPEGLFVINKEMIKHWIYDGCWYSCPYYCGMTRLEKELNKTQIPWYRYFDKKDFYKANINVLLYTDNRGKTTAHLLSKENGHADCDKKLFNEFSKLIDNIPLWSFDFLFTLDNRYFSGRYVNVTFLEDKGWKINEFFLD